MKINSKLRLTALTVALGLAVTFSAHGADSPESEALAKASVSLPQAIQIAEKKEPGKTLRGEFGVEKNKGFWEILIFGGQGVKEYRIDGSSGAVIEVEDEHIRGRITNFVTGMKLNDLENAKTTLIQALSTAEKKANGKAVKVNVQHDRGGITYDVFVRTASKTEKVKVDGNTGLPLDH